MTTQIHFPSAPMLAYQTQFAKSVTCTYPGILPWGFDGGSYRFFADEKDTACRLAVPPSSRLLTDIVRKGPFPRGLAYCDADFRDAVTIGIGSTGNLTGELDALLRWETQGPDKALLRSLPGAGKSYLLGLLSKNPTSRRRIFCFHSKAKRNEFWKHHLTDEQRRNGFHRIFANLDIVLFFTEGTAHRTAVKNVFAQPHDDSDTESLFVLVRRCIKSGYLSKESGKLAMKAIKEQQGIILKSTASLVMCSAKFRRCAERLNPKACIVYIDEVVVGELTEFPEKGIDPYNPGKAIVLGKPEFNPLRLRLFKTCYVTCEQVIEAELRHLADVGMIQGWQRIGTVKKCFELGLTIVWSGATSSRAPATADISKRKALADELRSEGYFIIADKAGADANHVNSMGRNNLRNPKNAVIASFPAKEVLCKIMLATGMNRSEAEALYISDRANQGVGRNMGYRKRDESDECLLVLPKSVSKRHLLLDFVTTAICTDDKATEADEPELPTPEPGDLLHEVWPDLHPKRARTVLGQLQIGLRLVKVGKRHGNRVKLQFQQMDGVGCVASDMSLPASM